jgi:TolA-binding protein
MMRSVLTQFFALSLCVAVLTALFGPGAASGTDVWTPETGEVNLEEMPRDTLEDRFRHAAALITAGQPISGIKQLRKLVRNHPEADWVEKARYMIGVGHLSAEHYRRAFRFLSEFRDEYPESKRISSALEVQLLAASQLARKKNLTAGIDLLEALEKQAPNTEFAARCQKKKADVLLDRGDAWRPPTSTSRSLIATPTARPCPAHGISSGSAICRWPNG